MRSRFIAPAVGLAALALSLLPVVPSVAHAAPADQLCLAGVVAQHDMAGVYASAEHRMRVELYPCGGALVQWGNAWGDHTAGYVSIQRVPGEGIISRAVPETPERLDGTEVIGFKAAERGYIQVFTVNHYGEFVGVYRLRKVA